jgi:hypothetical protein
MSPPIKLSRKLSGRCREPKQEFKVHLFNDHIPTLNFERPPSTSLRQGLQFAVYASSIAESRLVDLILDCRD